MQMVDFVVIALQGWGVVGALVALVFLTIGLDRIDEDARHAYVFRPLLIPGILMIWPLVLWRWWQIEGQSEAWAKRYRPWRAQHGLAACLMAIAVIAALIAGLSIRQSWPVDTAPLQLSEGDNT